jgi:molybdopterin-guanine dinucleotide biosynthesis protein A
MGVNKAVLRIPFIGESADEVDSPTFAERTGRLLREETDIAVEVGPGFSRLPHVSESPPGSGPLVAFSAGVSELTRLGWDGPVLLVATDLPLLNRAMLRWLATHPPGCSVVPVRRDRPQPLCARYEHEDALKAQHLVAAGSRAMFDLIDSVSPILVAEETWVPLAGDPRCLNDVDTPEQLDTLTGFTLAPE